MIDERYDRDVQHARARLGTDVTLLFQAIGEAFRVLTRIQFDEPWRARRVRRRSTRHA
jgi:hypothetical protein